MLTVKADGADRFEIGTKGLKERGSDIWDSFPIEEPVMLGFEGSVGAHHPAKATERTPGRRNSLCEGAKGLGSPGCLGNCEQFKEYGQVAGKVKVKVAQSCPTLCDAWTLQL